MGAAFRDAAVFDHQDLVRADDGRQAMRHHQHGLLTHDLGQGALDQRLRLGIERRRRFVENQDRRLRQERTGDRDELLRLMENLVENALREVSEGKVEAALMMGASNGQVIRQVYVPEALPGLIGAATVTAVTLVSYTAMAGAVGGGFWGMLIGLLFLNPLAGAAIGAAFYFVFNPQFGMVAAILKWFAAIATQLEAKRLGVQEL